MFCFAVAPNLIERLEIAFFSVYSASKSKQRLISTFFSMQNQIVEIVLQTVQLIDPAENVSYFSFSFP